jgi:hypothetical protein
VYHQEEKIDLEVMEGEGLPPKKEAIVCTILEMHNMQ